MHPELRMAYERELPRLEAGERLAAIVAVAAGSGRLRNGAQLMASLRAAARPGGVRAGARNADPEAFRQAAAARGIAVRVHRREG
jgi:hypothetical protein